MNKLRWLAILMGITIAGITGFQLYWLRDNYNREKQNLEIKTSAAFRQTVLRLQASKLQLETYIRKDSSAVHVGPGPKRTRKPFRGRVVSDEPVITVANLLEEKMKEMERKDSSYPRKIVISTSGDSFPNMGMVKGRIGMSFSTIDSINPETIREVSVNKEGKGPRNVIIRVKDDDTMIMKGRPDLLADTKMFIPPGSVEGGHWTSKDVPPDTLKNSVFRFLYNVESISVKDSVTVKEIDSAFAAKLKEDKMDLAFNVAKLDSVRFDVTASQQVTVGFSHPITYRLNLLNGTSYVLGRLKLPILFSLLLVGITIASFVLLYRNLLRQHRLAQMKNDLISNITHELKTPIATVGVAIEALKNFNAIQDPQRTKEYLDISQNELQRLSLLVDKVLKLSMFENKDIEIKYEVFRLEQLVEEVVASLRLQLEKTNASVTVSSHGDTTIKGDRLHLLSVVFNLLDNALKYSRDNAIINVDIKETEGQVVMKVKDNGIGIPLQYREKVFEKFFRVPAGDTHNAKGHGLGLSYAAQVVYQHQGTIRADEHEGPGSTFTITLPKMPQSA